MTGVDKSHANANLATHMKASNFHSDVMAAVKRLRGKKTLMLGPCQGPFAARVIMARSIESYAALNLSG